MRNKLFLTTLTRFRSSRWWKSLTGAMLWSMKHNNVNKTKYMLTIEHPHPTGAVKTWFTSLWGTRRATLPVPMVLDVPGSGWKSPKSGQHQVFVPMNILWLWHPERIYRMLWISHQKFHKQILRLITMCGFKTQASSCFATGEWTWLM